MENKKTKAKYYYQTNKRTSRKIMKNHRDLSDDEKKLRKDIMLPIEIKICQIKIEKKNKIWEIITRKEKFVKSFN